MDTYSVESAVRGFHVYQTHWSPIMGEILTTEQDRINPYDKYAVSIKQNNIIVGHVPREQSKVCNYFIKRGGVIQVEITNTQKRRSNIPEGGLEIEAVMVFVGTQKDIAKLSAMIQDI